MIYIDIHVSMYKFLRTNKLTAIKLFNKDIKKENLQIICIIADNPFTINKNIFKKRNN